LKNGRDGQESPTDLETTEEDPFRDEQKAEVIEPQPEPVPSARDEFHQAYTKKLQAVDKDEEQWVQNLDLLSYPVRVRVPLSPTTKSSYQFVSARPFYLLPSSSFSSTVKPTLA